MLKNKFSFYVLLALALHIALINFFYKFEQVERKIIPQKKAEVIFFNKKKLATTQNDSNKIAPKKAEYVTQKNHSATKETFAKKQNYQEQDKKSALDPLGLFKIKPNLMSNQNDENLDKLQSSSQTNFNTVEWKHAAFFERIRKKIAYHWTPGKQISLHDPQRKLFNNNDVTTALNIVIDNEGQVIKIEILSSSSIFFLDDEAINAIKKSSPFSYPPKELFDNKDEFSFQFAFTIYFEKGFNVDFNW